jgi:hypothetical protein
MSNFDLIETAFSLSVRGKKTREMKKPEHSRRAVYLDVTERGMTVLTLKELGVISAAHDVNSFWH